MDEVKERSQFLDRISANTADDVTYELNDEGGFYFCLRKRVKSKSSGLWDSVGFTIQEDELKAVINLLTTALVFSKDRKAAK